MRLLAAALVLTLLASPAFADKVTEAADKVVEAIEQQDRTALQALAQKDEPDPWRVADELCARGKHDAAVAFAKAAPRVDTERLPVYVERMRSERAEPGVREALVAYNRAYAEKRPPAAAMAALAAIKADREDVSSARVHHARGWVFVDTGRFAEAAASWQRAGAIALKIGWLVLAEQGYNGAAGRALDSGNFDLSLECCSKQLEISRRRGHALGVAYALNAHGLVYRQRGEFAEALSFFEKTVAHARKAGLRIPVGMAQLNSITIHAEHGDFDRAIEAGEEALEIFRGPAHLGMRAKALEELGGAYHQWGRFEQARARYSEALALFKELGDEQHAAVALMNLAGLDFEWGDVPAARSAYEQLIRTFRRWQDRHREAQTLAALGRVHLAIGDFDEALACLGSALRMLEQMRDRASAARVLNTMAAAYFETGRADLAFRYYERALETHRALGQAGAEAETLRSLAMVHWTVGEVAKGEATLRRARAIYQRLGHARGAARLAGDLGLIYAEEGRHEEALDLLKQALTAYRELKLPLAEAQAHSTVSLVLRKQGRHDEALRHAQLALKTMQKLGGVVASAYALASIAELYDLRGDRAKATECYEQSVRAAEDSGETRTLVAALNAFAWSRWKARQDDEAIELARRALDELPTVVRGLGEEQGALARGIHRDLFEVGCLAGLRRRDVAAVCLFLESGRAGTLLEALGGREALRGAAIPRRLREAEQRARAAEQRARQALEEAVAAKKLREARQRRQELAATRDGVKQVISQIQREAKAGANLVFPQAATPEGLRRLVQAGEALVVYGLFKRGALALVVTRDEARIVRLKSRDVILKRCQALVLDDPETDPRLELPKVRRLLVEPLGLGKEVTRLTVSPHGALATVPFCLIAGDREVAYVASGTTYGLLRAQGATPGKQVLALGDPSYAEDLDRLPATRAEAKAVGDTLLLGEDATKAKLLEMMDRDTPWRAVHFACHGLVDLRRPMLSALALTPGPDDDGSLTAFEVLRARVPAELAVLSACETGRGKVVEGEGILGFTRCFMFAGTPRVLVSLWKVEDRATRSLMTKFYELWNPREGRPGLPAATALKRAQDFVRSHDEWRHPSYWAAWQLWGLPD